MAALDRSEPLVARLVGITQRQAEWRAQKRLSPPPILPPKKGFTVGKMNMGGEDKITELTDAKVWAAF